MNKLTLLFAAPLLAAGLSFANTAAAKSGEPVANAASEKGYHAERSRHAWQHNNERQGRDDYQRSRADIRGDRIERRLDARGDRIQQDYAYRAQRAANRGNYQRAYRLMLEGYRINARLDRRGQRINARLDGYHSPVHGYGHDYGHWRKGANKAAAK